MINSIFPNIKFIKKNEINKENIFGDIKNNKIINIDNFNKGTFEFIDVDNIYNNNNKNKILKIIYNEINNNPFLTSIIKINIDNKLIDNISIDENILFDEFKKSIELIVNNANIKYDILNIYINKNFFLTEFIINFD